MSRVFRGKFCDGLKQLFAQDELQFHGSQRHLTASGCFHSFLQQLFRQNWVAYAKPPFGGPQRVLEYLGRYTHRVAISNRRLLALENNAVSFDWKDYRDGQQKVMTVAADEFIRRFLQHSLPSGLQRIRYYGFLANCHRAAKLELCRQLLATAVSALLPQPDQCRDFIAVLTGNKLRLCPRCGIGILASIQVMRACHGPVPLRVDTS